MLAPGDRIVTFDSTHHALRAETLLEAAEVEIMILPTPRELTASCGLAIRYRAADEAKIREILGAGGIQTGGRYRVTDGDGKSGRRFEREDEPR